MFRWLINLRVNLDFHSSLSSREIIFIIVFFNSSAGQDCLRWTASVAAERVCEGEHSIRAAREQGTLQESDRRVRDPH